MLHQIDMHLDFAVVDDNFLLSLATNDEIKNAEALKNWAQVSSVWKIPPPSDGNHGILHVFVKFNQKLPGKENFFC
jgi:hypothetical protein